jgi:hypothetical protein
MSETTFFDDVASVGGQLLEGLRGRSDVAPFLLRTRDVYALLVAIHDDIATAAIEVSAAQTLEQAHSALRSLEHAALESVFRARRWCDELEALGHDLSGLPPGVVVKDLAVWQQFTETLTHREGEVASLYESALYSVLSKAKSAQDLHELQDYMQGVSEELIVQKARFDLLAKQAAAMARRR